jgi:hypothetical protein
MAPYCGLGQTPSLAQVYQLHRAGKRGAYSPRGGRNQGLRRSGGLATGKGRAGGSQLLGSALGVEHLCLDCRFIQTPSRGQTCGEEGAHVVCGDQIAVLIEPRQSRPIPHHGLTFDGPA